MVSIRRHYFGKLQTTMISTFQGPGFDLNEKRARILAEECMKVIRRNHRRAIKAGYVRA
jgi:hypothetical protein